MRQKRHILKTPELGIELPQSGRRPDHRNAHVLRTRLSKQAAGVQQAFFGVEVKFDAGHQLCESKGLQDFRKARALDLTLVTGMVDWVWVCRLDCAEPEGPVAPARSVRY